MSNTASAFGFGELSKLLANNPLPACSREQEIAQYELLESSDLMKDDDYEELRQLLDGHFDKEGDFQVDCEYWSLSKHLQHGVFDATNREFERQIDNI